MRTSFLLKTRHSFALRAPPPTLPIPPHTSLYQVWPNLFPLGFSSPGLHVVTLHIDSIDPPKGFHEWGNIISLTFNGPLDRQNNSNIAVPPMVKVRVYICM